METPLSLAHLSELDTPPLALVDLAAAAGFASIGLRTIAAAPGGVEYPLRSAGEQAALRSRLDATGVELLYIEMISLTEAMRPEDYRPALEIGARLGATRLAVGGDSADLGAMADQLAAIASLAAEHGIAVDLEFMPFRGVRSLEDAVEVVRRAGRPNAHILIDALHVFRSGSSLDLLRSLDPAMLGTFQICDAPLQPPPPAELVIEARTRRLLPGEGGLALWPLIDALPPDIPLGVEVPLAGQYPSLSPTERAGMLVAGTRVFMNQRRKA